MDHPKDTKFKLSAQFFGHEADVRSICTINNLICSVSRDNTLRIWAISGKDHLQLQVLQGHLRSKKQMGISSVTYIKPTEGKYPKGALVTAGWDDNTIIVWDSPSAEMNTNPILRITGHDDTVTSLSVTNEGDIISGSVDKTVRVWRGKDCIQKLEGHQHIVWAVLGLPNGDIVSASADKTIRIWRGAKCHRVLNQHLDAVRDLALVPGLGFLSCSNDWYKLIAIHIAIA
eukprot:TRINITY_DN813_c0_g1_i6.p1 TRINITY_DN813_c0_g1~~TRINITY_DN813_c0_g1_i6.p1  ORF type:complete len:239 (+),score=41.89 TRINITY_DN813_c0_g1_i6:30-719(+)